MPEDGILILPPVNVSVEAVFPGVALKVVLPPAQTEEGVALAATETGLVTTVTTVVAEAVQPSELVPVTV